MADYQNFKINPSDYLGFEYEDFQNQMYAVAMADAKKYFEIRNAVVKKIRDATVEKMEMPFTPIYLHQNTPRRR